MDSICKFIPPARTGDNIHTISFVSENRQHKVHPKKPGAVYVVNLVTEGSAVVTCGGKEETVFAGDVFFLFPAVEYSINGDSNFRYMYVSFIGIRANAELERLGINARNFVFRDFQDLFPFWNECMSMGHGVLDMISESVLLYTLSRIGNRSCSVSDCKNHSENAANAMLVKKFVDDYFADPELSLDRISLEFSYSKKYISTLFKKHYQIGLVEYINTARIRYACSLLDECTLGVADAAFRSGFKDALYFSRVFKQKTGITPTAYMMRKK